MTLLDDLRRGAAETAGERECPLCAYLATVEDEDTRFALTEAAAGTIGIKKLTAIMKTHETGVSERAITRHRREDHTP